MTDTATTAGGDFPPGTPVYQSDSADGTVLAAQGDDSETASVTGIAVAIGIEGSSVLVKYAGPLRLTAAQWDAVTGDTGGLTRGARYFVSSSASGELTTTAPVGSGDFVTQVGIALSSVDMMIQPGPALENP